MKSSISPFLRSLVALFVTALFLLGVSGCVTTTEINEGDGVIMQEQPPPSDQVQVYN